MKTAWGETEVFAIPSSPPCTLYRAGPTVGLPAPLPAEPKCSLISSSISIFFFLGSSRYVISRVTGSSGTSWICCRERPISISLPFSRLSASSLRKAAASAKLRGYSSRTLPCFLSFFRGRFRNWLRAPWHYYRHSKSPLTFDWTAFWICIAKIGLVESEA